MKRLQFPTRLLHLLLAFVVSACGTMHQGAAAAAPDAPEVPYLVVLGIAQDAGYPQAACRKACCAAAWQDPARRRRVACLALVDPGTGQRWLIDATPDIPEQLQALDALAPPPVDNVSQPGLAGVLLTHGHVGHYLGLAHLGREVTGAARVPVYAMPRMAGFLTGNGPWSLLVRLNNIEMRTLAADRPVQLSPSLRVTPIPVPHRGEFSETVAFRIDGPGRSALYLPDIDKWGPWDRQLAEELARVDIAWLDGTFFRNGEIPGRDMGEIPHPFIEETMGLLADLPAEEKAKVRFIHLNHTNPALDPDGRAAREIRAAGYGVAEQGRVYPLVSR